MKGNHRITHRLLLAAIVLLGAVARADLQDTLKPLLVRLPGWENDDAEALKVKKGILRTTAIQRAYYQGQAEITALLMAGSRTMIDRKIKELRAECEGDKIGKIKLNGFPVRTFYNAADKTGVIVVLLNQGPSRASMFSLNFDGIREKQALSLAKKFDWKQMQAETVKL